MMKEVAMPGMDTIGKSIALDVAKICNDPTVVTRPDKKDLSIFVTLLRACALY